MRGERHADRLMCQAESRADCNVNAHWTPVPPEVVETTAGEREVEALGTWLEHYLGNYTFPANYVAPLYGQTHREVAKYVGPVIAEDLLDSPALAALLDRVRREEGERIAQAIEAEREAVDAEGFGWYEGCRAGLAEAARIARAASVGPSD